MKRTLLSAGLIALLCSVQATAQRATPRLTPDEKLSDLQQLVSLIKSQYGPYEYKKTKFGIDVDKLVVKYGKEAEGLGNLDYYYLINRFVAEFKDAHFRSTLKTDHVSGLGFITDRVEGKVVIDTVNRRLLSPLEFPFQAGDEVVTFDGKPAAEVVADLARYIGAGYQETTLRLATMALAYRPSTQLPPQHGKVKVGIRPLGESKVETVELKWLQAGNSLEEDPGATWGDSPRAARMDYLNLSVDDLYSDFPKTEKSYRCSGTTRIEVPKEATMLLTKPFVAYYWPTPKGNLGYLRIPHYNWPKDETELRLKQYAFAIEELEAKTVGLVIDQAHNCGGSVTTLESMLQFFATKSFQPLQFRFLASRNEFLQFKAWMTDEELTTTLEGQGFGQVLDIMKTAWIKGDRLTPKTTYHGSQLVAPASVRYTKPILVLIDEMSGSGGDAFPAMMQGMGRAKLFGERTMGAGGHVVDAGQLNYSGNQIQLTKSMFFHPNGSPIENNGATPDIRYTPTLKDFLNGYVDYRNAYTEALLKMIAPKPLP